MSSYALPGPSLAPKPVLPGAAGGQDSQYAAAEAQLRADVQRRYADILQQLGYTNESGQFLPGEVELQANRQKAELQRGSGLAAEEVTNQAQQQGTLFSGKRATNTARAQHPFVQGIADLAVDVPRQLTQLYTQAGRTIEDYTIQNNMLLADAAARAAAKALMMALNGGISGGGGYGGGGGGGIAPLAGGAPTTTYGSPFLGNLGGTPTLNTPVDYGTGVTGTNTRLLEPMTSRDYNRGSTGLAEGL